MSNITEQTSAQFYGLCVYEIIENGNVLNGIYTNNGLLTGGGYAIDNEIARKENFDDAGIGGTYKCRYIETTSPTTVTHCLLKIVRTGEGYEFTWVYDLPGEETIWKGIGLRAGNNHIAVTYSKP